MPDISILPQAVERKLNDIEIIDYGAGELPKNGDWKFAFRNGGNILKAYHKFNRAEKLIKFTKIERLNFIKNYKQKRERFTNFLANS